MRRASDLRGQYITKREDAGIRKEIEMTCKRFVIPILAGAIGAGAVARAAEPTTTELMQQIQALQAKVQQLEQKQEQAVTRADVDATAENVLRDADKQSKLFAM